MEAGSVGSSSSDSVRSTKPTNTKSQDNTCLLELYTEQMRKMLDWALSSLNRSREELIDVCFVVYLELYVKLFKESSKNGTKFLLEFMPIFESKFGHFIDQLLDCKFVDQLAHSPVLRLQNRNRKHLLVVTKRTKRSLLSWLGYNQECIIEHILQECVDFIDGEMLNHPNVQVFRRHFISTYGLDPDTVRKYGHPFYGLYIWDYDNQLKIDRLQTNLLSESIKHYVPLGLPGDIMAEDPHGDYGEEPVNTINGEFTRLEHFRRLVPLPRMESETQQSLRGIYAKQKENRITDDAPTVLSYTFQNVLQSCSCAISHFDGRYSAVGLDDGAILLWDLVSSESTNAYKDMAPVLGDSIASKSVMKSGTTSVVRCKKGYNSADGEGIGVDSMLLFGHDGSVQSLCFGECGQVLLSGGLDSEIRLWTLGSTATRTVYKGGGFAVMTLDYGPFGYYFTSCEADGAARLWATDRSFSLRIIRTSQADILNSVFHPNSSLIATPCTDGCIRIWDLRSATCEIMLQSSKKYKKFDPLYFSCAKFSKNGSLLASSNNNNVDLFDLRNRKLIKNIIGHEDNIVAVDFNHGTTILTVADPSTTTFWNIQDDNAELSSAYRVIDSQLRDVVYTPENVLLTLGVSILTDVDN